MTRLNLILYFTLIVVALGVVTSQHQSRQLYFELEQQENNAKKMSVEFGQLQLEQSTWSMHSRIEEDATRRLHMQIPDSAHIQVVMPNDLTDVFAPNLDVSMSANNVINDTHKVAQ